MNATFHWTQKVRLAPYPNFPDMYDVGVEYADVDSEQFFKHVHVPAALKRYLEGPISGFQLETLDTKSPACRALRGSPAYAVVAVEACDGERVYHLPSGWMRHRRNRAAGILLASVAAVAAAPLHLPYANLVEFILGVGVAICWGSMRAVPSKAFSVGLQLGRRS